MSLKFDEIVPEFHLSHHVLNDTWHFNFQSRNRIINVPLVRAFELFDDFIQHSALSHMSLLVYVHLLTPDTYLCTYIMPFDILYFTTNRHPLSILIFIYIIINTLVRNVYSKYTVNPN